MITRGKLLRWPHITRGLLHEHPDKTFVFGDNMRGYGRKGQAVEMRGEVNALGVPTKWRPDYDEAAYFADADAADPDVVAAIATSFAVAKLKMLSGHDVVIPTAGIGTGLSELPIRAPKVYAMIQGFIAHLEAIR